MSMYDSMYNLLSDKKGGEIFTCFGIWHIGYIVFFLLLFFVVYLCTRRKSSEIKSKAVSVFINIAFGMYILDFFLMPFAYGEIDIEKLPFHACTAMCVMCFLSRRIGFLKKFRIHFALLGLISNMVYLIYPAGVMWHAVGPFSYRVIQTLSYHGIMTVFGLLALVYEGEGLEFRKCYRSLIVLAGMTLWAFIGNTLYNGSAGNYSNFFNWFFVVEDPFGIIDKQISPFIMPWLNIIIFFAVELAIYGIYHALMKKKTE